MEMKIGVCGGSFDPPTLGHLDLFRRASRIFDKVIVVIAKNPGKNNLFTADERKNIVIEDLKNAEINNVQVDILEEGRILVKYAETVEAISLIRSMRSVNDFEAEFEMALHNSMQASDIETIFIRVSNLYDAVRSSSVRDLARLGGRIDYMVTKNVEEAIRKKLSQN
jgi:pantetheine-phosphate adenylyltransferase